MNKKHRPPVLFSEGEGVYFLSARTYGGFSYLNSPEKKKTFKEILFEKAEKFQGKIKHWVIMSNHYHLLIELEDGALLSRFVGELHGASAFKIKKLPCVQIVNEEQIVVRELTPLEMRTKTRIADLWRELKLVKINGGCRLKPARTTEINSVLAGFSPRFSNERKLKLAKTIETNDFLLFEVLVSSVLSEIPFWHSCYNHFIRNETDYFRHFNYITQNPIKHGVVKKLWDYEFSGVFNHERDYIIDCLRNYPIVDFEGEYD